MENHPYSLRAITEHEPSIMIKADRFLQRILTESSSSKTHTVDVHPLCGLFSLGVICQAAFNRDIDSESPDTGYAYLRAMGQASLIQPISNTLPVLARTRWSEYLPGVVGQAYKQRRIWEETTRELYREFAKEASSGEESDKFLAHPFRDKTDEFLGRKLTEDEAIEEAMGLAFAGSGTTATTILYVLYHLSRPENRGMQLRLREELLSTGTKYSKISDLKYLSAVIKEAMRLNPSLIGTLPRVLTTSIDTDHGETKFLFPPGTLISMQNYVHHRDPSVYPDPHTFNPDRWIGISQSSAAEKSFTPYSLGPRNCIGQNLANLEIRLGVSHLFRHLDFRLSPEMREGEMEMEDRFAALTRGGRLLLNVGKL
jgi:cytochrome P450